MANKISDETIEYVGILAKLELTDEEKEAAKSDMEKMLDYIDTLVDGPFVQSLFDPTLVFRGSRNQRILHLSRAR